MEFTEEKLEPRVVGLANLPTLPGIIQEITELTECPETNAGDVATVISSDPVLSAKVLRLVNSPVYGFPGRISSITHAVVLLGYNVVKGLALGTAVFGSLGKHVQGLWEHSFGCAVLSRRLARKAGLPDVDEVMVAGLLHDLGKVVLAYLEPEAYDSVVDRAKSERQHIAEVERAVFSVDHARVNGWLADQWHFPTRLTQPIVYHHDPDAAAGNKAVVDVVHLADVLARAMGYGFPGDLTFPALSQEAFGRLGLPFEELDEVLAGSETDYVAGLDVFSDGD
jgi:putative nucleotidyltransferase with HDIG domain